jgi:hypothetical protein
MYDFSSRRWSLKKIKKKKSTVYLSVFKKAG